MNPNNKDVFAKSSNVDNEGDILVFEFETEEEAFYFKLKYGGD